MRVGVLRKDHVLLSFIQAAQRKATNYLVVNGLAFISASQKAERKEKVRKTWGWGEKLMLGCGEEVFNVKFKEWGFN